MDRPPVNHIAHATREIPLTRGYVALVDAEDYEWISAHRWYAHVGENGHVYAMRGGGGSSEVRMHREIVGAEKHQLVDHRSGDTLDNRRSNLRTCNRSENAWNRAASRGSSSGFKGVSRHGRRWRAQIYVNGHRHSLGVFSEPEDAASAYDAAARDLHGEFARLNLPRSD